jgi:hypothetical protein
MDRLLAIFVVACVACGSESPGLVDGSPAGSADGREPDDSQDTSTWSSPNGLVDEIGRLALGNQIHLVGHKNGMLVHLRSADGVTLLRGRRQR